MKFREVDVRDYLRCTLISVNTHTAGTLRARDKQLEARNILTGSFTLKQDVVEPKKFAIFKVKKSILVLCEGPVTDRIIVRR